MFDPRRRRSWQHATPWARDGRRRSLTGTGLCYHQGGMAYPGDQELSAQAQDRVMAAFRQVVSKLQDGDREAALIGLEFVLRLDPSFAPAVDLHRQLGSGAAEIDLSEIITHLRSQPTDDVDELLVEAVEAYNQRDFVVAREKVDKVLVELPGHQEARQLLTQIREALKVETQVGQFLTQAREALDRDDPQEAANFVMMAQALDPHHEKIESTLKDIYAAGGADVNIRMPVETPPAEAPGDADDGLFQTMAADDFDFQFDRVGEVGVEASADRAQRREKTGFPGFDEAPEGVPEEGADPADWSPPWSPSETEEPQVGDEPASDTPSGAEDEVDGDVADLFGDDDAEREIAVEPEWEARIEAVLREGQSAYDSGDFTSALDLWSRVFLLDRDHDEAARCVADARRRKDEIDSEVEQLLREARAAADAGDRASAASYASQALEMAPFSVAAARLRDEFEKAGNARTEAAAPPDAPPPELPDLEDSLFANTSLPDASEVEDLIVERPVEPEPVSASPHRGRRQIPWRTVAIAAGAVAVILVGVVVGMQLLGGDDTVDDPMAVTKILREADELFDSGQVQEAIHLLEEFPASELDNVRIARRLERYREAIAPPTPTPVPKSVGVAETALADGLWLEAYREVKAGLRRHPRDPGLLDLQERILAIEPGVASLHVALVDENWRTAAAVADDLLEDHPEQPDLTRAAQRSTFNAALAELRAYNLTGAERYLRRLEERWPGDSEVARIQEFITSYKAHPVDMRLEVFIRSLVER